MYEYDIEKIRRKRAIKVIITDIFLACCVLFISFILIAAVAGWRINSDFQIEQNGLVSVHSKPVDATVIIDGKPQYQKTNMSKMLPGGKHTVKIEREGYTSWEKEVEITPGWLLRLEYPRLFKIDRESKNIKGFEKLDFFHVSPSRSAAILSTSGTTEWVYMTDFNASTPKSKTINIKGIFKNTSDGKFNHKINSIEWSKDNEKILLNVDGEWGIIDLKDVKKSVNLAEKYADFFENTKNVPETLSKNGKIISAKFEGNSSDKIVANVSNNLVRIDTAAKVISLPIEEKIEKFSILESSVIYLTKFNEGKSYIKYFNLGEQSPTAIAINTVEDASVTFALTKYNNTNYLLYTINNHLVIYSGNDFPNNAENKNNMKLVFDTNVNITASEAITSHNNEFIILKNGSKVSVFDTELEKLHNYDLGTEKLKFIDNEIIYRVNEEGKLTVWDFDDTNYRDIINDSCSGDFDVFISENERQLYYVRKNDNGYTLVQEKLW